MFYSHEVLHSRKHGVATVWLVATLGSKSNLKKVNRKAILNVDVPKACQTIVDPGAPMALRLQGNLLLGVSRVYLQQCGYVLSDAQSAQNAMRIMLNSVKNAGLDPDAGKARPEQLVLQDDPSFLPDFALPPPELLVDLDLALPLETPRSGESQSLTPFGSQQVPGTPGRPIGGLILPSSSSRDMGEFRVEGDDDPSSVGGPSGMLRAEDLLEPLAEPDFGFDAEGNFFDHAPHPVTPAVPGGANVPSDAGASARVRQEHEEGRYDGTELLGDQMELDLPILGDDFPEGEAFPTTAQSQTDEQANVAGSSSTVEATAAAPMRRKKRKAKTLLIDSNMELRNKDLADWNAKYLENMQVASREKNKHRAAAQAKKNAEFWVWGAGIGGIGYRMFGATSPTPLDQFYGDKFFELLTGVNRNPLAGTKHDRDSGIDEATQGESRRVRRKSDEDEEEQIGRGYEDEAMFLPGGDELEIAEGDEVELPRDAPVPLDDQQVFSAMPWNISASIRGSSAVHRSTVGGPSSLTGPHRSLHHRRGSRMVSASPLHGRGQPGGLEALKSFEGEDEFGNLGADDFEMLPGPSSDGACMEPALITERSVRVREALSAEGENFLTFVSDAITEKRIRVQAKLGNFSEVLQADAAGDIDEVLFEEVLPLKENTRMIAAQGLLMVLALGTRGVLNVRQEENFREIGLSLSEKVKAIQVAEADSTEEEEATDGESQFEEQFAAGSVQAEDSGDDHDSLYDL
ncbi:hypothetical protein K505DRAFT_405148 [Melanomma pulvis-pyrius CBS 109.77]|uniref:Rad21/Rec8-like protein N-terminal domain-containing protein n=1 Tax=Melanomma pulvis-pyrius CBS 109.77 TaxID=1314802 RepID=A0A6A6XSG6_9PLEO|nr:hypothetical protein K505DRAFT_405148 [Melanomma pulvis-pyrius CBS 109.77]